MGKGGSFPAMLWLATAFSLLGAVQFGYHVGVLNTCLSFVAKDLGISEAWGAVVVSALLVGAALGSLAAGGLADRLGPKTASIFNTLPLALGIVICAASEHLWSMLLGRLIAGLGSGAASVFVPRYLSEIAPDSIRGGLGTLNQVFINVGIVCAYAIGYPYEGGEQTMDVLGHAVPWWRIMFVAAMGPCILQAVGMSLCPETPVWLMWRGRCHLAAASYRSLHGGRMAPVLATQLEVNGEGDAEQSLLGEAPTASSEPAAAEGALGWGALLEPKYRRVMVLAAGLPLFQQLSGINTVIFYSSEVFKQAGLASPVLGSIIMGLVNLGMTLVTAGLMDRLGRKPLLTASHAGMAACLAVLSAFILLPLSQSLEGVVSFGSILAYVLFFALGSGPIPWVYLPEVLPGEIKGNAQAVCTCLNWVSNLCVGLSFPSMLSVLHIGGSYAVYAVLNVLAALFMARLMVETKRQPLQRIRALLLGGDTAPAP